MSLRNAFLLAASLCLISACEKIDLEEENGDSDAEHIVPHTVGMGTQEAPYTVEQVINGGLRTTVNWFIGYVVGSTYNTMDNCVFEEETSYTSNILLSDNPYCESADECIPIELKSATLQKKFSLYYNSGNFRQCVILLGRFGQYFRRNGIRDLRDGYWLPGFDYHDILPTDWEEIENKY